MKYGLLIITLSLFLVQTAVAKSQNIPNSCPTVSALVAVGVSKFVVAHGDEWTLAEPSNRFGTNNEWTFQIIGSFGGDSPSQVQKHANNAIRTLQLDHGPSEWEGGGTKQPSWYCLYYGYYGDQVREIKGIAITPTLYSN